MPPPAHTHGPRSRPGCQGDWPEAWAHLVVHHCLTRVIIELAAGAGIDPDGISFLKVFKDVRRSVIAATVTTATKMTDFMDTLASRAGRKLDSGPRRPRVADRLLRRPDSKYSYWAKAGCSDPPAARRPGPSLCTQHYFSNSSNGIG